MKSEYKLLGEICEVKRGKVITKEDITVGDIPVIAGGKNPAYYHNKSNILGNVITVSASGANAGYIKYHENPIYASDCSTIKSLDENKLLTKYVYYRLKNIQKNIYELQKGSGQPHVYPSDLVKLNILVPPLKIQEKIVFIFDKAEKLNRIRRQANENPLLIITALFFEMFGNPFKGKNGFKKVKLSEICEINPKKSEISALSKDVKVSFIEMASVSEKGEVINSTEKSLNEVIKGFTYFREGDILFAKITPCMENGKGAIAKGLTNGVGFGSTEFHILRPTELVLPEWLFVLTKISTFRQYCKRNMTGTAGQKRVPRVFLENMQIYLPPIELQKEFLKIYLKIQNLEKLQKQSTFEINKIYENLMETSTKNLIA